MDNIRCFHNYSLQKNAAFHIKCCVMQENISQIPEYLNYFNDQNISVLLKPVWFPSKYSLKSMSPLDLKAIIKKLETQTFKAETHFQKLNNNRYRELLNQLLIWSNTPMPENGFKSGSFGELGIAFYRRIDQQIENDHTLSETEKIEKSARCKTMGDQMMGSVSDPGKMESALVKFMDLPVELIIAEMERGNAEMLNARFMQEA